MTAAAMATDEQRREGARIGGAGGGGADPDRGCALADDFLPMLRFILPRACLLG